MGIGGIEPPPTGPKPEILSIKLYAHIFPIPLGFYILIFEKESSFKNIINHKNH
tara:strand:- start:14161 stop:14322 length:162 start_codon:yes stop_codon:yes gene_type:complete